MVIRHVGGTILFEKETDYPVLKKEFGHLEGDTIVKISHKIVVVALLRPFSKAVITLKSEGKVPKYIEIVVNK